MIISISVTTGDDRMGEETYSAKLNGSTVMRLIRHYLKRVNVGDEWVTITITILQTEKLK